MLERHLLRLFYWNSLSAGQTIILIIELSNQNWLLLEY